MKSRNILATVFIQFLFIILIFYYFTFSSFFFKFFITKAYKKFKWPKERNNLFEETKQKALFFCIPRRRADQPAVFMQDQFNGDKAE